jgi:hypothetical protein
MVVCHFSRNCFTDGVVLATQLLAKARTIDDQRLVSEPLHLFHNSMQASDVSLKHHLSPPKKQLGSKDALDPRD